MIELPKNSVARYRICTEKSVLGFGKYADLTVGDILKVDEEYIVWAYATLPKISFHKSILERLGIRQIEKPGTDFRVLYAWRDDRSAQFTEEQKMHGAYIKKIGRRKEAYARLMQAKRATTFTKGQLQAINHGHKK